MVIARTTPCLWRLGWGIGGSPRPSPWRSWTRSPTAAAAPEGRGGRGFQGLLGRARRRVEERLPARHGMGPSVVDPHVCPTTRSCSAAPSRSRSRSSTSSASRTRWGGWTSRTRRPPRRHDGVVEAERESRAPRRDLRARACSSSTRRSGDAPRRPALPGRRRRSAESSAPAASGDVSDVGAARPSSAGSTCPSARPAPTCCSRRGTACGRRRNATGVAGALLCQDWPGPLASRGPPETKDYLAAHQVRHAAVRPGSSSCSRASGWGTPCGRTTRSARFRSSSPPTGRSIVPAAEADAQPACWSRRPRLPGARGPGRDVVPAEAHGDALHHVPKHALAPMNGAAAGLRRIQAMTARMSSWPRRCRDRLQTERMHDGAVDATVCGRGSPCMDLRQVTSPRDPAVRDAPRSRRPWRRDRNRVLAVSSTVAEELGALLVRRAGA